MRRLVTICAAILVLWATPAHATGGDGGGTVGPKGDPVVYVGEPGADPVGSPGGTGSVECYLYNVTGVFIGDNIIGIGAEPEPNPEEGHGYLLVCFAVPSGDIDLVQIITYQPGVNIITPGTLANQALKELPLLYPRPRLAPPTTVKQVVGIRTWMWVDPADWHPISATAAIPGLAATVTATPTKTIWDMGDGATVVCNGPGTVYDPTKPDADQHSDCSHTYQHDGTYDIRATIVWSVTWTATNGAGGNLGLFQRTTQFTINVEQRQAVING
ncbi:MAG: hypothetical protein QOD92_1096 [Acidimicrobiaceae bacterium]